MYFKIQIICKLTSLNISKQVNVIFAVDGVVETSHSNIWINQ